MMCPHQPYAYLLLLMGEKRGEPDVTENGDNRQGECETPSSPSLNLVLTAAFRGEGANEKRVDTLGDFLVGFHLKSFGSKHAAADRPRLTRQSIVLLFNPVTRDHCAAVRFAPLCSILIFERLLLTCSSRVAQRQFSGQ